MFRYVRTILLGSVEGFFVGEPQLTQRLADRQRCHRDPEPIPQFHQRRVGLHGDKFR